MTSKKKIINLRVLLLLTLFGLPLTLSTDIDCNGKAFHCINSTHFMICVDLGGGVTRTVDNFAIPCPVTTVCQSNNYFECEFVPTTSPKPIISAVTNESEPIINVNSTTSLWEEIVTTTFLPFGNVSRADLENNNIGITESNSVNILVVPNNRNDSENNVPPIIVKEEPMSEKTETITSNIKINEIRTSTASIDNLTTNNPEYLQNINVQKDKTNASKSFNNITGPLNGTENNTIHEKSKTFETSTNSFLKESINESSVNTVTEEFIASTSESIISETSIVTESLSTVINLNTPLYNIESNNVSISLTNNDQLNLNDSDVNVSNLTTYITTDQSFYNEITTIRTNTEKSKKMLLEEKNSVNLNTSDKLLIDINGMTNNSDILNTVPILENLVTEIIDFVTVASDIGTTTSDSIIDNQNLKVSDIILGSSVSEIATTTFKAENLTLPSELGTEINIPVTTSKSDLKVTHNGTTDSATITTTIQTENLTLPSELMTEINVSVTTPQSELEVTHNKTTDSTTRTTTIQAGNLTLPSELETEINVSVTTPQSDFKVTHNGRDSITTTTTIQAKNLTLPSELMTEINVSVTTPQSDLEVTHNKTTDSTTRTTTIQAGNLTLSSELETEINVSVTTPQSDFKVTHNGRDSITTTTTIQAKNLTLPSELGTEINIPVTASKSDLKVTHNGTTDSATTTTTIQTENLTLPSELMTEINVSVTTPQSDLEVTHNKTTDSTTRTTTIQAGNLTLPSELGTEINVSVTTPQSDFKVTHNGRDSTTTTTTIQAENLTLPSELMTEINVSVTTPQSDLKVTHNRITDSIGNVPLMNNSHREMNFSESAKRDIFTEFETTTIIVPTETNVLPISDSAPSSIIKNNMSQNINDPSSIATILGKGVLSDNHNNKKKSNKIDTNSNATETPISIELNSKNISKERTTDPDIATSVENSTIDYVTKNDYDYTLQAVDIITTTTKGKTSEYIDTNINEDYNKRAISEFTSTLQSTTVTIIKDTHIEISEATKLEETVKNNSLYESSENISLNGTQVVEIFITPRSTTSTLDDILLNESTQVENTTASTFINKNMHSDTIEDVSMNTPIYDSTIHSTESNLSKETTQTESVFVTFNKSAHIIDTNKTTIPIDSNVSSTQIEVVATTVKPKNENTTSSESQNESTLITTNTKNTYLYGSKNINEPSSTATILDKGIVSHNHNKKDFSNKIYTIANDTETPLIFDVYLKPTEDILFNSSKRTEENIISTSSDIVPSNSFQRYPTNDIENTTPTTTSFYFSTNPLENFIINATALEESITVGILSNDITSVNPIKSPTPHISSDLEENVKTTKPVFELSVTTLENLILNGTRESSTEIISLEKQNVLTFKSEENLSSNASTLATQIPVIATGVTVFNSSYSNIENSALKLDTIQDQKSITTIVSMENISNMRVSSTATEKTIFNSPSSKSENVLGSDLIQTQDSVSVVTTVVPEENTYEYISDLPENLISSRSVDPVDIDTTVTSLLDFSINPSLNLKLNHTTQFEDGAVSTTKSENSSTINMTTEKTENPLVNVVISGSTNNKEFASTVISEQNYSSSTTMDLIDTATTLKTLRDFFVNTSENVILNTTTLADVYITIEDSSQSDNLSLNRSTGTIENLTRTRTTLQNSPVNEMIMSTDRLTKSTEAYVETATTIFPITASLINVSHIKESTPTSASNVWNSTSEIIGNEQLNITKHQEVAIKPKVINEKNVSDISSVVDVNNSSLIKMINSSIPLQINKFTTVSYTRPINSSLDLLTEQSESLVNKTEDSTDNRGLEQSGIESQVEITTVTSDVFLKNSEKTQEKAFTVKTPMLTLTQNSFDSVTVRADTDSVSLMKIQSKSSNVTPGLSSTSLLVDLVTPLTNDDNIGGSNVDDNFENSIIQSNIKEYINPISIHTTHSSSTKYSIKKPLTFTTDKTTVNITEVPAPVLHSGKNGNSINSTIRSINVPVKTKFIHNTSITHKDDVTKVSMPQIVNIEKNINANHKQVSEEIDIHTEKPFNKNINDNVSKHIRDNHDFDRSAPYFDCRHRNRGRYADKDDCMKFYICLGKQKPIIGACPVNTVFSEIKKQCTRNLSHCIRNNQFQCLSEGRFGDFFSDNIYYICVKHPRLHTYIRFKFHCQEGYLLEHETVRCVENVEVPNQSTSFNGNDSNKDSEKTIEEKSKDMHEYRRSESKENNFECEEEGKFPDPNDCRRYYVCSKSKKEFRRKKKKCHSDEVFHKDKKKCVDSDSYDC